MHSTIEILVYSGIAGLAIPLGAILSRYEHIHPRWLETELRHAVIAFGGGALLAAIALVLVPEGLQHLGYLAMTLSFFGGGLAFAALDRALSTRKGSLAQFVAMLSDFVPESIALGATFVEDASTARLLAILIAVQNVPEAFNAYREVRSGGELSSERALLVFALLAAVGPIAAFLGLSLLAGHEGAIASIMVFAAGGILYLTFQDIAPKVPYKSTFWPPFAALGGFFLGVLGKMFIK